MTAEVVDLAARRAERDAKEREEMEGALHGIATWDDERGWLFFADLRSGERVILADGLTWDEARDLYLEAAEKHDARIASASQR